MCETRTGQLEAQLSDSHTAAMTKTTTITMMIMMIIIIIIIIITYVPVGHAMS
jgi:heme/copper-type cytochrome/quinol oxidase subunit 2